MSEPTSAVGENPLLLELLLAKKLIDKRSIEVIMKEQTKRNCSLEEAILFTKLVQDTDIAKIYSEYLGLPIATPESISPLDDDLKAYLPEKFIRENHILPLSKKGDALNIAVLDPTDMNLVQEIQLYTGMKININVGSMSMISQGIDSLFGNHDKSKDMIQPEAQESKVDVSKETDEDIVDLDKVIAETRETKIIRLVNQVLSRAIASRCSDIHMEPYPDECKIRFRIDGCLEEIPPPPVSYFVPLISRLKILCKMDIAEKRIPQDGAFSIKLADNKIDVRVSTVPTVYGEKMVMRILNKDAVPLDLSKLGFQPRQCEDFFAAAQSPHGLLFVTGPTGSGKSTTLYATLNLLKSPKKNILTVEDPVEYKFAGINQIQVKPQVELTFARALRAFLRQDPDVIMVGEVRDNETAQICLRAALTGHFVLSTLHTNDALTAVTRLEDMGIEAFLIGSTLRLVEAQRLIRRLCAECKEPYKPTQEMMDKYAFPADATLFRPKGCDKCRGIGYKGRVGVFEVIRITPKLRDMIQHKCPTSEMTAAVRAEGMQTLLDNAVQKALEGMTSLEEVSAVAPEGGE